MQKPNHGKGFGGKIQDCPEVFNFHIERACQEKTRLLARQMERDTPRMLKSFSHTSDSLHSLSYSVYCGEVVYMTRLLPRKEYSLMIANIPYGRIASSINNKEPFKYNQLEKMIKDFARLTTTPLWRIVIFHSGDQSSSVFKGLMSTCHAVEGLT